MNLIKGAMPYFLTAFILGLILTPVAKKIGFALHIYAIENQRTVHHGKIVRIGGLSIFMAFVISMAIFVKADSTINAILIGAYIVFVGGLLDDAFNLHPMTKLGFQVAGAIYVLLFSKIELGTLTLPFITINNIYFCYFVSFCWIIGITNAINLIDGLDGLAAGLSFIMVSVIGLLSFFMGRRDVCVISLILIGSIAGFLPYNFHPASCFMGDCAAQFLGFLIACLSLLGFKSAAFITLGLPIIILFIPLSDTVLAIIRRKASGHKITEADRSHLHHVLMYKIGLSHRNTVLALYLVAILFGSDAILMYFNQKAGLIVLLILFSMAWIFIELTGMINPKFHPVIGFLRRTIHYPKKSDDAFFEANRIHHHSADTVGIKKEDE